jgi:hypothetical protein
MPIAVQQYLVLELLLQLLERLRLRHGSVTVRATEPAIAEARK